MVSVNTESISTQTAAAETQAASTQTEMTTSTSTATCTSSDSCGLQKSVSEPLVTSKSMTDKVQDLSEDVKRTLSDAQKKAQSKYEEAKDKVKGKVDEVKTKVDEVKTAADSKYEEVNSKVAEKYEEVKQAVTEKVSQAQETVQAKVEGAKTSAVTKYDEAKDTAVSKYEETKQSLQSKVAKVRKSLAEVQEKVQAKFSCHDDEDSASRASEDGNEDDTSEGTGATSAGSTTPTTPTTPKSSSSWKAESARKCVKRFSNKVRASLSGKLAEVKETVKETDVEAVQEKVKILAEKQKARVFKSWQELSTACKKRSSGNCCQHAGDAVEVDSTTSTGTTATSSANKIPASFVGGLLSSLPGRLSGMSWDETNITPNSLEGKVVIMTGGNNGLGYEATKMLCVIAGAHVVIASRSMERVNNAVAKIEEELKSSDSKNNTSRGSVEGMQLDLASLKSVRKFASDFKAKHYKLHILVHNAGIMFFPENDTKTRTEDGLERYTQINHLGAFLLTKLLLEPLKQAGLEKTVDGKVLEPARVVTVASGANWDAARRGVNFDPAAWTTSSTCSSNQAANCPCDPCVCKPVCECGTEVESPASDATVDPFPGGSMVSAFDTTTEDDKVAEEVEQKNVGVDQKTSSESEHQERKAKEYNRYGESKLMNILFMKSLAEKFAAADLPIISCGMHPGGSSTSLFDNTQSKFWQAFNALSMDSKKGSLGIVRCVVDTETVGNGDYVGPSMGMVGYPTTCTNSWVHLSPMARNKEQRNQLWAKSEEALGEKFEVM